MLHNGFGEHNIQGIGDKHIPLIHNVMNTDIVTAVSDRATDELAVLFGTPAGPALPRDRRGVPDRIAGRAADLRPVEHLQRAGRREDRQAPAVSDRDDVVMTVATDGAGMYGSERERDRWPGTSRRLRRRPTRPRPSARWMLGGRHRPPAGDDRDGARAHLQPRLLHLGGAAGRRPRATSTPAGTRRSGATCGSGWPRGTSLIEEFNARTGVIEDAVNPPACQPLRCARLRRPAAAAEAVPLPVPQRRRRRRRPRARPRPRTPRRCASPAAAGAEPVRPLPGARCTPTTRARTPGWATTSTCELDRQRLDEAVAGRGRARLPRSRRCARTRLLSGRLGSAAGGVWVKDETGNVAGSHKGRHLMGLLIHLEVAERLGLAAARSAAPPGHRQLRQRRARRGGRGRAGGRRLACSSPRTPTRASWRRLRRLGSDVGACPREPGVPGDPAYLRLREELAAGALPFTCQGNENGLAIEGGETIAYEMASRPRRGRSA